MRYLERTVRPGRQYYNFFTRAVLFCSCAEHWEIGNSGGILEFPVGWAFLSVSFLGDVFFVAAT